MPISKIYFSSLVLLMLGCSCQHAPQESFVPAPPVAEPADTAKAVRAGSRKIQPMEVSTERVVPSSSRPSPAAEQKPADDGPPAASGDATIRSRFAPPANYRRIEAPASSFAAYLQNLPLKPEGTEVKYYDGRTKYNRDVYIAVVDIDVGARDLQQCADAVMRLRAEFLWARKAYDDIHFNFTNGFRADYSKWRQGYRISIEGNKTSWYKAGETDASYRSFRRYLDLVFSYAGTRSLSQELISANRETMQIGDVFIQGGSPGHAIVVVDMAVNQQTGKKIFLLAQSYMPAQDIQILQNPMDGDLNPWYDLDFGETLYTPEWTFTAGNLKRFPE